MLHLKPLLISYDEQRVQLEVSCWNVDEGLASIRVTDRFGTVVLDETLDACPPYFAVELSDVVRGRLPLFIASTSGKGTQTDPTQNGPIFPAPTESQFVGGFALPPRAIVAEDDPVLRPLLDLVDRHDRAASAANVQLRTNEALAADQLRHHRTMSTWALLIAFVGLALGSIPEASWSALGCAALTMVAVIALFRSDRRARAVYRRIQGLHVTTQMAILSRLDAQAKLAEFGVQPRCASPKCGCVEGGS